MGSACSAFVPITRGSRPAENESTAQPAPRARLLSGSFARRSEESRHMLSSKGPIKDLLSEPILLCPLSPQKRTCAVQLVMSALGQKQTCALQNVMCPLYPRKRTLNSGPSESPATRSVHPGLLCHEFSRSAGSLCS